MVHLADHVSLATVRLAVGLDDSYSVTHDPIPQIVRAAARAAMEVAKASGASPSKRSYRPRHDYASQRQRQRSDEQSSSDVDGDVTTVRS